METIQSGMRLTPARLNPHRCIVSRATAQSVASGGVGAAITLTTAVQNTDGMWTSGTDVTIQKSGTYDLNGALTFAAGATGVRAVNIQRNGTAIAEQKRATTNQADPVSVSTAEKLTAGDVITLVAFHTQGANLNVSNSLLSVVQTGGA